MKTSTFAPLALFATALMLVGAGCPTTQPTPSTTPPTNTSSTGTTAPSPSLGFGKLPRPAAIGTTDIAMANGTSMAATAPQAMPMIPAGSPSSAGGAGVGVAAPGKAAPATRPLPIPYPNPKPVSVEYTVSGTLPTWGSSGDVLQVERTLPDTDTASAFAQNAGLPPQALPSNAEIQSMSLQWNDADGFQWTFDARGRTVSFWKNVQAIQPLTNSNTKPSYTDAEILNIANAFLDAHGFGAIRQSGGTVEDMPQIYAVPEAVATPAPTMAPCPILFQNGSGGGSAGMPTNAATVQSSGPSVGSSAGSASIAPDIAIPPCGGYFPQTVTVVYGGMREGKKVVDTNGNPFQEDSVTVSLDTKDVTGGNLQVEENVDRANYPLIDQATAMKRLQSGGQNPVYPWGSEGGTIKVNLANYEIVWMRYDAWEDNDNQTYYLPALLATGTVDRDIKGQAPESYSTLVPLVADSAFDDSAGTTVSPPPTIMPMPAVNGAMPINGTVEPPSTPGSGPNVY
ncbi:MAG: hypothetical protein WA001_04090 [Patescibacteria group bacterium]